MRSRVAIMSRPLVVGSLLVAGAAGTALAQSTAPAQALLDGSFVISVGAFILNTDIKAHLNGETVANPDVDFSKTFGHGNNANRARADAAWRITPTHHLRFMYFNNSRRGSRILDEEIRWGDYTYQVGGEVTAQTRFEIGALAYEYAFLRRPNYEVAASMGVHYTDLSLTLSGAATVTDANGNVTVVPVATRQGSLPAPLPVIGLRAGWVVSPQWFVDAQGQFFKARVGDVDGNWSDLRASATWMVNRKLGLGLGYNRFYNSIAVGKTSFDGRLRLGYSGVQLFATGAF